MIDNETGIKKGFLIVIEYPAKMPLSAPCPRVKEDLVLPSER